MAELGRAKRATAPAAIRIGAQIALANLRRNGSLW